MAALTLVDLRMDLVDPRAETVLLVEDKDSLRAMLVLALAQQGHRVVEAVDQVEAEEALARQAAHLVLTDLRLPRGDGLGVLRAARAIDPNVPVILMTAYGALEEAVEAMKGGALDFLAKPINPEHLQLLVARALAERRLRVENGRLKAEVAEQRGAPPIIGEHASIRRLLNDLQKAAVSDATVLIQGESGTGKEAMARRVHALSDRSSGPFVAVNCAAIPEALLESELFGHEKGAFTGAHARKLGKFEVADRGTLFLDEIGDLSLVLQPKLLRALESRAIDRVGGRLPVPVDVRIVAATKRSVPQSVADGRFREDLFFRLSVFPVVVPPLRERASDVPLLAHHFVARYCRQRGVPAATIDTTALRRLVDYRWPGNVRELQNCIERALILSDGGAIGPEHLLLDTLGDARQTSVEVDCWAGIDLSGSLSEASARVLHEVERRKIDAALRESGGDLARAADALRVPYRVLLAKVREARSAISQNLEAERAS
ncbi:MAG: sigma-54 dependent transcriptional regulator [Vicinamibacterales bacterium]